MECVLVCSRVNFFKSVLIPTSTVTTDKCNQYKQTSSLGYSAIFKSVKWDLRSKTLRTAVVGFVPNSETGGSQNKQILY